MGSKKMFAAVNGLALLLAVGGMVGVASAGTMCFDGADASRFDGAGRTVSEQRRSVRRKARGRMSERAKAGGVREGVWGGDHVRLSVREGGARVEFDCAHGEVGAQFALDAEGRFDLPGTYTREGPGPIRIGREPSARPARYAGRVEGQTMTLSVKLEGADGQPTTYTLTRGSQGRLWKCR
jgi:hypothetical protein